jgi:hypothetical protein
MGDEMKRRDDVERNFSAEAWRDIVDIDCIIPLRNNLRHDSNA